MSNPDEPINLRPQYTSTFLIQLTKYKII